MTLKACLLASSICSLSSIVPYSCHGGACFDISVFLGLAPSRDCSPVCKRSPLRMGEASSTGAKASKTGVAYSSPRSLTFLVRCIATLCWSLQFGALGRCHFKQLGLGQGQNVQKMRILYSLGLYFLFHTLLPLFSQFGPLPSLPEENRSKIGNGWFFLLFVVNVMAIFS